jgi:hypothetical protein
MADRQSSELLLPVYCYCNIGSRELDITYYQVGVLYQWHTRHIDPFVVGGLGITDIDLASPRATDETRFSTSIGGGFKLWFSEHVGFRFEARGYWTDTDAGDCWDDHWCDDWDDWYGHHGTVQGEFKAGVIFSF